MNGKKYNVGYTTGVFDMFHIGHLNILRRAKEQCSKLIVGVSTDELVRSYKQKVPVIPFEERFAIVAACRYVDEVVSQEDRDKIAAFHRIGFDVMFVGDDWKGKPLLWMWRDISTSMELKLCIFRTHKGLHLLFYEKKF